MPPKWTQLDAEKRFFCVLAGVTEMVSTAFFQQCGPKVDIGPILGQILSVFLRILVFPGIGGPLSKLLPIGESMDLNVRFLPLGCSVAAVWARTFRWIRFVHS